MYRIILKEYPARYLAPLPTQPLLRVLSRSAYDILFIFYKKVFVEVKLLSCVSES